MALSPLSSKDAPSAQNLQEQAILRSTNKTAGNALFDIDAKFSSNYSTIKSVYINVEKVNVTIEKILVTPTDNIALSLSAPSLFDLGENTEIIADVDDGCEIEWVSSNTAIATVTADADNPSKALVNGKTAGSVTITAKATKNGKTVSVCYT